MTAFGKLRKQFPRSVRFSIDPHHNGHRHSVGTLGPNSRNCGMRILCLLLITVLVQAQQPTNAAKPTDALYVSMASLDTRMFDAFNQCKLDDFEGLFHEGVEFYHDQGGLTVGITKVVAQIKTNICGKVTRQLLPGSLKVYPMHGYGALVTGLHNFYQSSQGTEPTGIAQFAHLWSNQDGEWKVTRVISFDHVSLRR